MTLRSTMSTTPILLIGSERSGTNLLRAIVGTHTLIASPPPCSMIDVMSDTCYKYLGDGGDDHFDVLIEDMIELTRTHLDPWEVECSLEKIKSKVRYRSFWDLFRAFNEYYAESEGKQHWFSKEPSLFRFIYELAMHLPDAKFIYLVRDPRDVVTSMLTGGIHEHNVFNAAIRWRNEQRLCLNAIRDPLLKERIFLMCYEELLENSQTTVQSLMDFLRIDFQPRQLLFYKNEKVVSHAGKSMLWKNLSKPIDHGNKGGYKHKLTKRQVQVIESLCWNEMQSLGYRSETAEPIPIPLYRRLWYREHALAIKFFRSLSLSGEARKHKKRVDAARDIQRRAFS